MHNLARAVVGAALLLSTGTAELALAESPDQVQSDMLAVVSQRDQMDQEMGELPGVFVSTPEQPGVLGVQARRDNLPDKVELDMLAAIGERVDMDRGRAQAPS